MSKTKAVAITSEVLPPEQGLAVAAEVPLHNLFHRNAMIAAAQSAGWLVLAGAELIRRKKALKHGEWEGWVEAHCEYNIRTAQKYMGLAEGVRDKMLKEASKTNADSFLKLLSTPAHQLDDAAQLTLLKSVHKLTDGQTLQQLYLDFGIVKKPQGSALKGGKNDGGSDGEKDPNAPEAEAEDMLFHPMTSLLAEYWPAHWMHLSDARQRELLDLLHEPFVQLKTAVENKGAKKTKA